MRFSETSLNGAFVIDLELIEDERGFFARTWCKEAFEEQGLNTGLSQISISFNARRGTLRGIHYQVKPHEEAKIVRCTSGSIYDLIADLRPDSPTFKRWIAVNLTSTNRKMLYVPEGCAHGFQTLEDNTEVLYLITEFYRPEAARGIRWDDPAFQFEWPIAERIMSERDRGFSDFNQ